MKRYFLILLLSVIYYSLFAQDVNNTQLPHMKRSSVRREINIPDIMGYKTLKCDFHIHTVFSDGMVWPTVRVDEAWEEGLDAIAITDHIEYRPHKQFVKGDHNASYEIALPRANEKNIILIKAGEVTRDMAPGHFNGLFIKDVNKLDTHNPIDALQAIVDQGGFVIWNHPGWLAQQPDTTKWYDIHHEMYKKGLIHGIEVFNEKEWYPISLDWCINKKLTMFGNSDIHDVCSHYYDVENSYRPMTLVFAKDRSQEAIKEALFAQRTAAWFDGKLAGKPEFLKALFNSSVSVKSVGKNAQNSEYLYEISNSSVIPFEIENTKGLKIVVPAESAIIVTLKNTSLNNVSINNLFIGTNKTLKMSIDLP